MKHLDEYRDAAGIHKLAQAIHQCATRSWTIMEVCGGQTHAILRFGIERLLPDKINIVHGPGCPVCVTAVSVIDKAIALAMREDVILCTFGDMLRVPGSNSDLSHARAEGADVRIIYSPMDAIALARRYPAREVVVFAIGFETTTPAYALAAHEARRQGLENFSLLCALVRVPPAIETILSSSENQVQGFLAAGHVCTVNGLSEYESICKRFHVPIVATGFEPMDILIGIQACVLQLEAGRAEVENCYPRCIRTRGNEPAQQIVREVFEEEDQDWRGMGRLAASGLSLRAPYADFDANRRFQLPLSTGQDSMECISGMILQGRKKPDACAAFGTRCTPETPLGAPMVSSEGACAAYFRFRNHLSEA